MALATQQSQTEDLRLVMRRLGEAARAAAAELALASNETKNRALIAAAKAIRANKDRILAANAADMESAKKRGLSAAIASRTSPSCPIPSARCWRNGRGRTD